MRLTRWSVGGSAVFALAVACATNRGRSVSNVDTDDRGTDGTSQGASPAASDASPASLDVKSSGDEGTTFASASSSGAASDVSVAPSGSPEDAGATGLTCDPRKLVCKRAAPSCEFGYVPRIIDGCYGECVRVDECPCDGPDACPDRDRYTCNNSRQRCTPYLN